MKIVTTGQEATDPAHLTSTAVLWANGTIQTTIRTRGNTNENKEKNDYWLKYTFIVGIAAAVLVICTVIAIVTSRYKSLRKAREQYEKDQMRAKLEIEKRRRESKSRTLSTTASITEPFYIDHYASNESTGVNPFDDVFESADALVSGTVTRNSFVQAIPSFSQAIIAPVAVNPLRQLDVTPPPRLSPSFQSSDERFEVETVPSRRHSMSLHPNQTLKVLEAGSPPQVLPREPILPPRRARRHSHQNQNKKKPLSRQRSHSAVELRLSNYGYIPEEQEPPDTIPRMKSLPEPDYD